MGGCATAAAEEKAKNAEQRNPVGRIGERHAAKVIARGYAGPDVVALRVIPVVFAVPDVVFGVSQRQVRRTRDFSLPPFAVSVL